MAEPLYRNYDWLKTQIDNKLSFKKIADLCGTTTGTIYDWAIYRFKIKIPGYPCITEDKIYDPRSDKMVTSDKYYNRKIDGHTKVAILGSTGFVGQNLTKFLKTKHIHVIELNRKDADLMNLDQTHSLLEYYAPDIVINLAAIAGGIGLNKENPAMMMYRNLQMGVNVLQACYANSIRKLIFLGSVCSYPKIPKRIPFCEDDMWDSRPEPTNEPYGLAKKTVGFMMGCYYKQYNYPSAYLIPTNMYGPHDDFSLHSSHVIPAMINKFYNAKKNKIDHVTLWGDGSPSRDFLYVDDCCRAIWSAIKNVKSPEPINIGSGKETTMKKLAKIISEEVGFNGKIIWDTDKPNGQPRRKLNISRAKKKLGFKPNTDLEVGIRKTIRWYKSDLRKKHV